MHCKKELLSKRIWENWAKQAKEEEVVFGKTLSAKWSRAKDIQTFVELEKFLGLRKDQCILDVGCGPLARAEVQFGLRDIMIVGLDISRTTLKKAKNNVRRFGKSQKTDFILGDSEFLPLRENKFDATICIGTISHLPTIKCAKKAIKEMKRVTVWHGVIFITWLLNLYSVNGIQEALKLKILDLMNTDRVQFLKFRGLKGINNLFQSCGLKILKIRYSMLVYDFVPLPTFLEQMRNKIMSFLNTFHERNRVLSRFSSTFEVKAEKTKQRGKQGYVSADTYHQFF